MTLTIDVSEAAARFDELLAEAEAGHEVVIARGAKAVARVMKEPEEASREEIESAAAALLTNRKNFAPVTIDEIIAWKNEGRR